MKKVGLRRGKDREAKAESGRVRCRSGHVGASGLLCFGIHDCLDLSCDCRLTSTHQHRPYYHPSDIVCTLYCFSVSRAIFHHPPLSRQTRLPGAVRLTPP